MVRQLSTGHPATLGGYRTLTAAIFGTDSRAVKFLDAKIANQGADEEVLAPEGQMVYLLTTVHLRGVRPEDERIAS